MYMIICSTDIFLQLWLFDYICSKEGVTQLLFLLMYAISVLLLIQSLSDHTRWTQTLYAADLSYIANLEDLKT